MRKIFGILLSSFVFFGLIGCGSSWNDKFKVSNLKHQDFSVNKYEGDIENLTNKTYYNVTIVVEFKGNTETWSENVASIDQLNQNTAEHFKIGSAKDFTTYEIKDIEYSTKP